MDALRGENPAASGIAADAGAAQPGSPQPGSAAAIEAAGFSFSYPGGAPVLDRVDWRVPAGSFALLVGDTGCGKTTLLRCCKPELAPEGARAGSLALFGRPADAWSGAESAAGIGYVSQSPDNQIVCDSVWHELAFGLENLGLPHDAMRRRVAEVAHFFGIEPLMHRATDDLSGGQKQMVCLSGVLAMQPRLLLLDEPTSQLDPVAGKNFAHALFRINRELGITVVVATHAPESMAAYATACFRLEGGRVQEAPLEEYAPLECRQVPGCTFGRDDLLGCHPDQGDPSCCPPNQGDPPGCHPERSERSERSRGIPRGASGKTPKRPSRFSRQPNPAPLISLRDVHFRYAKDAPWVLRSCDLSVERGTIHALIGGNGCGKSTLLRLAAGVLAPERGRCANAAAARQALLPQSPRALFVCDTVDEELAEWRDRCGYDDDAIARAARESGLACALDRHPYDLSGGQQQKLALAKLMLTDPDLLLLDEPTKGLDPRTRCEVARALTAFAQGGGAVLMATHDLSFVSLVADCVTLLFDGEAACTEPVGDFFTGNLFYRPPRDGFARLFAAGTSTP